MFYYDVVIEAFCPERKRGTWDKEKAKGYTITYAGDQVKLEGRAKTVAELLKIDYLVQAFPDHHISLKRTDPPYERGV